MAPSQQPDKQQQTASSARSGVRSHPRATAAALVTATAGRGPSQTGIDGTARQAATPPANPFVILAGWVGSAVGAIWMALAHMVGAVGRALGRSARDLDPLRRRDGLGLTALCAAIVAAVATWWRPSGLIKPVATAVVTLFGSGSWTIPILLGLLAWRFLRHPDSNADTARMVMGWTALLVGALGLVHVASGTPELSAGLPAHPVGRWRDRVRRVRSAGRRHHQVGDHPGTLPDLGLRPARRDRDASAPRSRPNRGAARIHPAPAGARRRGG